MRPHCFILTEACSCRLELASFEEKIAKNRLVCKNAVAFADNRDFKIHYGGLLLRLLRPWGTRLTTPFPPQTSNRLRFRCTATGCSVSTCLYKNGYDRLYSTFIWQRLHQWQWFPSFVSILHLPELRFVSQLLLEPPAIPTKNKITLIKSSISARVGCS